MTNRVRLIRAYLATIKELRWNEDIHFSLTEEPVDASYDAQLKEADVRIETLSKTALELLAQLKPLSEEEKTCLGTLP
jgi:hypothetical protein